MNYKCKIAKRLLSPYSGEVFFIIKGNQIIHGLIGISAWHILSICEYSSVQHARFVFDMFGDDFIDKTDKLPMPVRILLKPI